MKTISLIIALGLLAGCATQSLEELEAEAAITGDWSAVEKREKALARFNSQFTQRNSCKPGETRICDTVAGLEDTGDCVCRQGSMATGRPLPETPPQTTPGGGQGR